MSILLARPCGAITVHLPGYSSGTFSNWTGNVDIDIDSSRTFFLSLGSAGISKVTAEGDSSRWSTARATDLVLLPDGSGYAAGRALCKCLYSLGADGSFTTLHQDSLEWIYVALTADGTLYSTIWAGANSGLYRIDRTTGEPTPVVLGGPGPGGAGMYLGLATGADGKLYVSGSVDYTTSGTRLFRLDGSQLTPVAILPHGGRSLTPLPDGTIYVIGGYDYGSGYPVSEVWGVNPTTGETWKLASSGSYFHNWNPQFHSLASDHASTLYVEEGGVGIWAITKLAPAVITFGDGVSAVDTVSARISWPININRPLTVAFERRTETTDFSHIGSTQMTYSGWTGWLDATVVPGTRYGYRARAIADTVTVYSSTLWVDVPPLTPPPPPIVVWEEGSTIAADSVSVTLDWPINPVITGDVRVERREPATLYGSIAAIHLTGDGHVHLVDTSVVRGANYVYRAGVHADTGWVWSGELAAQLPPPAVLWGKGEAKVQGSIVTVEWPIDPGIEGEARIERRTAASGFGLVATLPLLGDGKVQFVDEAVHGGENYFYRAGIQGTWSEELEAILPVVDPVPPTAYTLAFARGSLIAQGAVDVAFTVPSAGRAQVDAFDIHGRRVASSSIEPSQPGPYAVHLAAGGELRPGMYFLRLAQGAAVAQCRAIVLGR